MRLLFFFFLILPYLSHSQEKQFKVKYINEPITIDAVLDEGVWETAESAADFWQYFPSDSLPAAQQTEIKMLYDDKTLYIGIKVYAEGNDYIISSLRRDFRAGGNDNISLLFDTFNDGTNAFLFGINPYGVRREALISGGGSELRGFNTTWDVKWKGEAKIYDHYYIAEMAIPLTSFKFREGETKWRFNSYRFDTQTNEQSTWQHIPRNQFIFNLAFMGDMVFEKPLGRSRTPLAIIPYVNALAAKDFEEDNDFTDFKVGGDAKVAIGNGMNLDITVNPDFSNVEVDNLVTNLTRFEISLPERRQFFIDNSDLFANFGNGRDANPFFSRRIGIAQDIDGNSIENRILGGVRLSGKLNKDWRLGFLNLQTEKDEANEIASNNNTVLALQRKVFARSNIGLIFVNRQAFGDEDFLEEGDRYNRVLGIDYNLASKDNTWVGKFYTHKSFASNGGNADFSAGLNLNYNSRHYRIGVDGTYVGADFRSDLGFIRRSDILRIQPSVERIFWAKNGKLNNHRFELSPAFLWRPGLDFQNTDYNLQASWNAEFRNTARISAGVNSRFTFLTDDFDPTGTDGAIPLPGDQGYYYTSYRLEYQSDRRKAFSFSIEPSGGAFFNGDIYSIRGQMSLRVQPYFSASLRVNYDRIELPDPFPSADILLVSPRFDITFSKSIFWSTLVQYSNQSDNLGINTRLQWRFAPLSDLFIVYNDNYFTLNTFAPRNRSINLKLTYWLNI
ncbi:hydrolase [Leptobacterium flavescens]|uniref:Hydrolase n=1 Tax=Leptobacterium flavescens TaxID=472055 RepID=A0A6P0UIB1_9FLAO|nr:carbohydrate binding family 9 domain-containing protein [Leptobacterium flavescens]NER12282.1 hydrolase [Leptobacterium flavescens]